MTTKTIADIDVAGKKVLMRVDFNVPLDNGKVTNDKRIVAALPSIKHVLDGGAALILMSHLGRPKGQVKPELSLKPVADRLAELLDRSVTLGPPEVVGPGTEELVAAMKPGNVVLLENVRFHPGETMPDKAKKNPDGQLAFDQRETLYGFVQELGRLGEVYVNDAFGTCHRKHASMYGAAKVIKAKGGPAVAGFLVEKEIKYLHDAISDPAKPFVVILGGAKVSDKIKLISTLLEKVDRIIIGGAMAYTLLKSQGIGVGKSLVEEDQVEAMKDLLSQTGDKIVLPEDNIVTDDFATGKPQTTDGLGMADDLQGMDIGPDTIKKFSEIIAGAKTIVWNGPMGVFEKPDYAAGTKAIAKAVAQATEAGAVSVIGGGDSATAVDQMGLAEKMTHVSTGGGASLTYLEGKPMPALDILDQKG